MTKTPLSSSRNIRDFLQGFRKWEYGRKSIAICKSGRQISQYLSAGNGAGRPQVLASYDVTPTDETKRLIDDNFISVLHDRIYFQLIVFDACAHLYGNYNQILGSRLIAEVDLPTLLYKVRRKFKI